MGAGRFGNRKKHLMNSPRLEHIELSNFRSIRGCVSIPLNADIVLIHGSNGTGKTSFLSGLELGLTGKISTLASMSDHYAEHLLHEGTMDGAVRLQISQSPSEKSFTQIDLHRRSIAGKPLLSPELAQFFSERSYLAQATLGRLLELYQASDKRGDSLLTRFVNDLLGLDHLDALIEGLAKSGDIRATRKLITELGDQERLAESLRSELAALQRKISASEMEAANENYPFASNTSLGEAPVDIDNELSGVDSELEWLLPQLTELRKLRQQFNDSIVGVEVENLERADGDRDRAKAAWSHWDSHWGVILRQIRRRAHHALHTDATIEIGNPAECVSALRNLLKKSIAEARANLTQTSEIERKLEDMHLEVSRLSTQRSELATRESEYRDDVTGVASLGHALASLVPHIDSDLCPACGRDFQEVSEQPLIDRVRDAARSLNLLAERLQIITAQQRELDERLVQLERAITSLIPQLPEPLRKSTLESELHVLSEIETSLAELEPQISEGTLLWEATEASANRRASLEASNLRLSAMRERVQEIAAANHYPATEQVNWPTTTVRIEQLLNEKLASLNARRTFLRALRDSRRSVATFEAETARLRVQLNAVSESLEQVESQTDAAKVRIDLARALMKAAVDVRQSVVAEVFDAKLNDTWRDLFIKLAPGEPFTPKFVVKPRARAKAGAELQVVHRNADRSGPPSALLSAGNLNTAALTLFLSLHLAAEPKLPWLILDDPIQAMDDIHISHFAALLRSFAHDLSRQVVIAVHERSLFDYLALELSPARPGQRLVTVELSRKSVGETSATIESIEWEQDRAIVS